MIRPKMIRNRRSLKKNHIQTMEYLKIKQTCSDTGIKCTDECTINANAPSICCNIYMEWYHPNCVGISNVDEVGAWVCASCRLLPKIVELIKSQMTTLIDSTQKMFNSISLLTEKMENQFEYLNDR